MGNSMGKASDSKKIELLKTEVEKTINTNSVVVYSKTHCPYCKRAKNELEKLNVQAKVIELDTVEAGPEIQQALLELTNQRTVPNIFINRSHIGGCDDLMKKIGSGSIKELLEAKE